MRVETPQILWNSEADKGINAALNSISMLDSGLSDHADNAENGGRKYGNIMVTAGNTNIINLWKLSFPSTTMSTSSNSNSSNMVDQQKHNTKITYLCSLTRQEMVVNAVAFSPDGLHLATGGESGAIVVWSVPPNMRGGGNGRHYWSTVHREQDLSVKIISGQGGGVCDISWSADSKRFIAGTIEHNVLVCEDKNYDANQKICNEKVPPLESDWKIEFRSTKEHTHYVQGVAYDPLGVYLASMGSDRTVRVFPRKTPPKSKKKVLRPTNATFDGCPPPDHQRLVDQLLTESKLEFTKPKQIKYRTLVDKANNASDPCDQKSQKRHLYADEATHVSFFRRLSWTSDGAYLVTPAALWHSEEEHAEEKSIPSFATYLFARHKFDEPYKVLTGLEKPSVVVRPSPVLYKMSQPGAAVASPAKADCKENESPLNKGRGLPYRSIFAVLTTDTILVYDTHHTRPLSIVRGLHYAGLSDCQWSSDGTKLVVSSIDGYISIVSFEDGELGEVFNPSGNTLPAPCASTPNQFQPQTPYSKQSVLLQSSSKYHQRTPPIPPCEPGQSATLEAPPSKRHKKTRITPTLITPLDAGSCPSYEKTKHDAAVSLSINIEDGTTSHAKRSAHEIFEYDTNNVGEAVTKLTLSNDDKPKKKKRIQPVLVSANT